MSFGALQIAVIAETTASSRQNQGKEVQFVQTTPRRKTSSSSSIGPRGSMATAATPSKIMIKEANTQLGMMFDRIASLESELTVKNAELVIKDSDMELMRNDLDKYLNSVKVLEIQLKDTEGSALQKDKLHREQLISYQDQCQNQLNVMKEQCKLQMLELNDHLTRYQSDTSTKLSELTKCNTELKEQIALDQTYASKEISKLTEEIKTLQDQHLQFQSHIEMLESENKLIKEENGKKTRQLDVLLSTEDSLARLLSTISELRLATDVSRTSDYQPQPTSVHSDINNDMDLIENSTLLAEMAITPTIKLEFNTEEAHEGTGTIEGNTVAYNSKKTIEADVPIADNFEAYLDTVVADVLPEATVPMEGQVEQPTEGQTPDISEEIINDHSISGSEESSSEPCEKSNLKEPTTNPDELTHHFEELNTVDPEEQKTLECDIVISTTDNDIINSDTVMVSSGTSSLGGSSYVNVHTDEVESYQDISSGSKHPSSESSGTLEHGHEEVARADMMTGQFTEILPGECISPTLGGKGAEAAGIVDECGADNTVTADVEESMTKTVEMLIEDDAIDISEQTQDTSPDRGCNQETVEKVPEETPDEIAENTAEETSDDLVVKPPQDTKNPQDTELCCTDPITGGEATPGEVDEIVEEKLEPVSEAAAAVTTTEHSIDHESSHDPESGTTPGLLSKEEANHDADTNDPNTQTSVSMPRNVMFSINPRIVPGSIIRSSVQNPTSQPQAHVYGEDLSNESVI